ncbi:MULTISPECIES: DUF6414 family protein [unclassified Corynebacterium]|uniref:DUF6414 family protein n=1 Tax=unclassified Corynebacterium TaxID=2624378 RepID=UPI0018E99A09|nr:MULTISPECIES: DUF6414 family protein [unclassified Corynebacterium]
MAKRSEPPGQPFVKVVYFDEDSASDFLDMRLGGQVYKEETNIAERNNEAAARAAAEAGAKFKWLNFFSFGVDASAEGELGRSKRSLLSKTLSNTILTDYLRETKNPKGITVLNGYSVTPAPESLTHVKMFSPYINLIKDEGLPLDFSRMDEVLASAKGYYEMIASRDDGEKCVLRFNLEAFRNNYGLPDLPRMNLEYHGIRVGTTAEDSLDAESELDPNTSKPKHTPSSILDGPKAQKTNTLNVYDVLFAGVKPSEQD